MEPRIQYAKTNDGVSIAYWVIGEGRPIVHLAPLPFTHLLLEWDIPEIRHWYQQLACRRMLLRYDSRGLGLSDRNTTSFSLDHLLADLEAVVDHLGLNQVALIGTLNSGPAAIGYAARHPERVSELILWCTYARGEEFFGTAEVQALRSLIERDWRTFSETTAHSREGWTQGEAPGKFAALIREAVTPQAQLAFMDTMAQVDVTELLDKVEAPTLVLHRRDFSQLSVRVAQGLAAGIKDAKLILLEGSAVAPYLGNSDLVLSEVLNFLQEPPLQTTGNAPSGTAIILFADIADSTALTERLGDTAFRAKARDLDAALRTIIRENAGTPIEGKLLGDGVLAVFTSARHAIGAALACARSGDDASLPLHLGLHAGDVIEEEGNVFGGAVNIASRISALSAPGEVLVSETVRSLARTSAGVRFEDRGEQSLKGVGDPVRVWRVVEGE